jgi:phosphoglycerate dehydrogenase-like enzyme
VKIVLCGSAFPRSGGVLSPLLPDDDVEAVTTDALAQAARTADVLVPMMSRIDAALIAATSARLIQQWGAGLEGVDVEAATEHGIYVANVPSDMTANAESTAEHALLLMLGVARRLRACERSFEVGVWGAPLGDALFGRRALIVGFGRVGKALARRLVALGMRVDAVRRTPEPGEAERSALERLGAVADLPRFVPDADFLVCTSTATADARGMLNAEVFRAMKRTAAVVNVSRGAVINEPDLIDALRDGTIAGAGLDVFAEEPVRADHPLLAMEQVLATPHIAGVTVQSYQGIAHAIVENVRRVKAGEPPANCVNLARLTRPRALRR